MKKILLLGMSMTACIGFAQVDWDGIPIIPDSYAQKIGKNGILVAGEVSNGDYFTHNTVTGKQYLYSECHGGMGNCIAENGWLVASNKQNSKGAILFDGEIIDIPSLSKFSESYLYGITWDGSRICGIISNPNLNSGDFTNPDFIGQMYVPVYLDVFEDGTIGEPNILPYPKKDFFGAPPQYCSAVWISDDGKRILGQVLDDTGFYMYPVIYDQGENGEWSYSLPSESLFNQDKVSVPKYPKFEMEIKQVTDFMTPEMAEEFEKDYEYYQQHNATASPEDDPYNNLDIYMTPEELKEYKQYETEYQDYSYYYYNVILEEYYQALVPLIQGSVFFHQGIMTLDSSGRYMASSQAIAYLLPGQLTPTQYNIPWIFDLQEGTIKNVGEKYSRWNTNQLLPDGTLVVASPNVNGYSVDSTPVHSAVLLPGNEEFTDIADWIKYLNPSDGTWLDDYLFHEVPIGYEEDGITWKYKDMYVTGLVAVSDDANVFAGGVDGWSWDYETGMYFTYVISDVRAAIKEIKQSEEFNGEYKVFNLHGVNIMNTKDSYRLNELPKGIYIINGKKVVI